MNSLQAILQHRGITQLIVTGVTTEVCVNTTVREANDRGYESLVLEDCCGSYSPEFHVSALKMIAAGRDRGDDKPQRHGPGAAPAFSRPRRGGRSSRRGLESHSATLGRKLMKVFS